MPIRHKSSCFPGCEAVQQPGAGYHHGGRLRGPRASRAFWFGPEEAGGDSEYQLWQVGKD